MLSLFLSQDVSSVYKTIFKDLERWVCNRHAGLFLIGSTLVNKLWICDIYRVLCILFFLLNITPIFAHLGAVYVFAILVAPGYATVLLCGARIGSVALLPAPSYLLLTSPTRLYPKVGRPDQKAQWQPLLHIDRRKTGLLFIWSSFLNPSIVGRDELMNSELAGSHSTNVTSTQGPTNAHGVPEQCVDIENSKNIKYWPAWRPNFSPHPHPQ